MNIVAVVPVLRVVAFNHVIVVAAVALCENETFLETKKESGRGKRLAQQVLPFLGKTEDMIHQVRETLGRRRTTSYK